MPDYLGTPQTFTRDPNCCCDTGTGTGTCECNCMCCCHSGGFWSEYTFTIPTLDPGSGFGLCCTVSSGTWTVKFRGDSEFGCVWTTDETVYDDGITCVIDPTGTLGVPVYEMTISCNEDGLVSIGILGGGFFAIQWEVEVSLDGGVFPYTFCIDGGTLFCRIRSLAADCFDGPIGIGPDGGGGEPLVVTPTGEFIPCS